MRLPEPSTVDRALDIAGVFVAVCLGLMILTLCSVIICGLTGVITIT